MKERRYFCLLREVVKKGIHFSFSVFSYVQYLNSEYLVPAHDSCIKTLWATKCTTRRFTAPTPRDGASVWCPALSPLTPSPGASADCHGQASSVCHRTWISLQYYYVSTCRMLLFETMYGFFSGPWDTLLNINKGVGRGADLFWLMAFESNLLLLGPNTVAWWTRTRRQDRKKWPTSSRWFQPHKISRTSHHEATSWGTVFQLESLFEEWDGGLGTLPLQAVQSVTILTVCYLSTRWRLYTSLSPSNSEQEAIKQPAGLNKFSVSVISGPIKSNCLNSKIPAF